MSWDQLVGTVLRLGGTLRGRRSERPKGSSAPSSAPRPLQLRSGLARIETQQELEALIKRRGQRRQSS